MLLTIFGLALIIISETLLFSSVEAHTFQITAYCTAANPDQMPIPINAEAKELFYTCLGHNTMLGISVGYKITDFKIRKIGNEKKICTYTIGREANYAFEMEIDDRKIVCDNYSEFRQIKITAYCNANMPINAKAKEIYNVCLANNGIGEFGYKITVNEVLGKEEREDKKKYICTYIFEQEKHLTKNGEGNCVDYSEIDEEKKELAKQNAKVGGTSKKNETGRRGSGVEKKGGMPTLEEQVARN